MSTGRYIHTDAAEGTPTAAYEEKVAAERQRYRDTVAGQAILRPLDEVAAEADAPCPPNPFHRANMAANEVSDLRGHLEAVVERLIGSVPESDRTGGRNQLTGQPGAIHDLAHTAETIVDNVARMHALLDALERMLP